LLRESLNDSLRETPARYRLFPQRLRCAAIENFAI
jgi:hypothetical protein